MEPTMMKLRFYGGPHDGAVFELPLVEIPSIVGFPSVRPGTADFTKEAIYALDESRKRGLWAPFVGLYDFKCYQRKGADDG